MQSSVIDEILKVEDQAEKIVKSAEAKASEIILQAEENARNKTKEKLNELKLEHLSELESLNSLLDEKLEEYKERSEKLEREEVQLSEDTLNKMVESVCSLLEGLDG